MPKPLVIAGIRFSSQSAAVEHARRILHADAPGTAIVGADAEFAEELLGIRPDKILDLQGMNVVVYWRDWRPTEYGDRRWNMCFWAELEDGTRVDFSFMKAIKMLADAQKGSVVSVG